MPKRILLIDDEEDIREVAQVSLETSGWQVTTAGNADEGMQKALTERPDAIVLDVMMPEVDGPTLFARLRNLTSTRHIPVIFLTAKVQAVDCRRFADLGVNGIIAKPFDPLTLAHEISAALNWPDEPQPEN